MTENPTADSPFGTSLPHDPFQAAKASALKAAEELRAAATQKASEFRTAAEARAHQFRDTAEHTLSEARVRYDDLRAEAEKFAREKPLQALLTAFGVGFIVGTILRR